MVKTEPIKKNYEFMKAYKKGKYFVGRYMVLYVLRNIAGKNRLGITASKKIGKSVRRNRIKRLIRESFRYYEEYLKDGFDFIIVSRNVEEIPGFLEIRKEMKYLFRKLEVFDQEKWSCSKERQSL